ncbi:MULTISPECIES: SDR family NAD(P)-dependent oxidoreductase [Ramlibacter]|uniref:SDR family NAD(P)-dependent oxidoreductase n=1 Tax=Ramlibacter aquaticus TaxID=2780094 RepID=A0ABR9SKD1_9BURK|nr:MULTISPECIES: SDR family NAD(P)-dependent oxidoreductase [Ramlibacter]MBE7942599.1 SDR family NAD(P)-dependent oxidoreductase [Ramlibacter aquaticus]
MDTQHLTLLTGASRGMGLAMARQCVAAGHDLVAIARRPAPELDALAAARGTLCEQWAHDLADAAPLCERLAAFLGHIGPQRYASVTLINNAGLIPAIAPLGDIPAADLAAALRVDLEAPMLLAGAFLRATAHWTGTRRLLNISSGLGRRPMASQAAYCAAKAGMDLFTRCVALEEAQRPNGARVCSLAPGVIDTDMQVQLRGADAGAFPDIANFIGFKDKGLLASPEEAARKVLAYLARPDFGANPLGDVRDA